MFITQLIIVLCIVASLYALNDQSVFYKLAFSPYEIKTRNQWYRAFTHAFIHADFTHLGFNMIVLYQFGGALEKKMKIHYEDKASLYFILLYLGGILFATLLSYKRHQDKPSYYSVGASGAVSAVIFATIIMWPGMRLSPLFIPFAIPGFIYGALYIVAEILMDRFSKYNIAHDAHLMGSLYGISFICLIDMERFQDFLKYVQNYFGG